MFPHDQTAIGRGRGFEGIDFGGKWVSSPDERVPVLTKSLGCYDATKPR